MAIYALWLTVGLMPCASLCEAPKNRRAAVKSCLARQIVCSGLQTRLNSLRFSCKIVSFTAAKTKRMFSVSVAHVKWE